MCENCMGKSNLTEEFESIKEGMKALLQKLSEVLDTGSESLRSKLNPSPLIVARPLSKAEAMEILQVGGSTIGKLLRNGELPFFRINGRQIRIMPEDLNAYMVKFTN